MKSMLVNKTYGVIPELHFAIKNRLIFLDLCELLQNFKLRSSMMHLHSGLTHGELVTSDDILCFEKLSHDALTRLILIYFKVLVY